MGDSDRLVGAAATVVSIDTGDTVAAPTEERRARAWRSHEPSRPDHGELPTIDPSHYVFATEIARGGMGRIAIARDLRLGREVAVKEVIAESDDLARRFEREVRITARLQHPSIVSVHEAGRWPTGEPFYAMKLVSGRSLHDVIAGAPTLAQRLASIPNILAVADAMAYVHQQRVIHRDLKPHNVIVGEFGETVVIDWGLAKQLDAVDLTTSSEHLPTDGETSAGAVLGTLAYMPPEQAAGDAVDARADVYAIGAILYHVLTGRPPFAAPSFAELLAQVHDETPRPIASIEPDAPADLIAIAEHAMARDRDARYPTAKELADDLRRFQTGQLVGAHRYSLRELLWRWIRRHRGALGAVGVAIVAIVVVGVVAVRRVMEERARVAAESEIAQRNQADAIELMEFMLSELRADLLELGRLDVLETTVKRALKFYETHHGNGTDDEIVNEAIAREAIAEIEATKAVGDTSSDQARRARTLARFVWVRDPSNVRAGMVASDVAILLGRRQLAEGDSGRALTWFREALDVATRMVEHEPKDRFAMLGKAKAETELAGILDARGDRAGALASERAALALLAPIHVGDDVDADRDELIAHSHIGTLLLRNGDADGALAEYRAALAIGEGAAKRHPKSMTWTWQISNSHTDLGKALRHKGDIAAASDEFRAAFAIDERLAMLEPDNMRWQHSLSVSHEALADMLLARHDVAGAASHFEAAIAAQARLVARDSHDMGWRRDLSVLHNKLGDVQAANNDFAGAIASYREGLAVRTELVTADPSNMGWQRDLFYSHFRLAGLLDHTHARTEAIVELRAACDVAMIPAAHAPDDETSQHDLAMARTVLGEILVDAHDAAAAKPELEAALAVATRMAARPHPDREWPTLVTRIEQSLASATRAGASPRPRPPAP